MSKYDRGCDNQNSSSCNDNNCTNSLAACFFSLPPKQFALLSSLVGILLIDNLDLNQQNSLGNFIVNVGQSILTAAAQGQFTEKSDSQDDHVRQQIQQLKQQILALEKEVEKK